MDWTVFHIGKKAWHAKEFSTDKNAAILRQIQVYSDKKAPNMHKIKELGPTAIIHAIVLNSTCP